MNLLLRYERKPSTLLPFLAVLLTAAVGALDWLHGQNLNLTIAYLTPVALAALLPTPGIGVLIAALSAGTAAGVAYAGGRLPLSLPVYAWNTLALFALGLFLVLLVGALRRALREAFDAGRIDPVTGVADLGRFRELTETEMTRTARYRRPLTLACLDIDTLTENPGEQLLFTVAQTLRETVRKTDLVTRLDDGRFAVLLPETGQEAARVAVAKIHERLGAVAGTKRWPGHFSIGVVTCSRIPSSFENLLEIAGHVLNAARSESRKGVNYTHFDRND